MWISNMNVCGLVCVCVCLITMKSECENELLNMINTRYRWENINEFAFDSRMNKYKKKHTRTNEFAAINSKCKFIRYSFIQIQMNVNTHTNNNYHSPKIWYKKMHETTTKKIKHIELHLLRFMSMNEVIWTSNSLFHMYVYVNVIFFFSNVCICPFQLRSI